MKPEVPEKMLVKRTSFSFKAVVFILLAGIFSGATAMDAEEGNVVFTGSRLKIYFQPLIRSSSVERRTLRDEVGRLNLMTNIFDNYLEYLVKLGKIASSTSIVLEYNPEGADEPSISGQRHLIRELGYNSILAIINRFLEKQLKTAKSALLTDGASLLNIRDQLSRRTETMERDRNFVNLSEKIMGLEPDGDFTVLGNSAVISIRPLENTNQLMLLPMEGSASVFLPPQKEGDIGNLKLSSDAAFLAFTAADAIKIMKLPKGKPVPLFSEAGKSLLGMEWAPNGHRLAGIVIDKFTSEREIFVYDADKAEPFTFLEGNKEISGNFQFAYPFWNPQGSKLLFCSGDEIDLIDLEEKMVTPKIAVTRDSISEILWAPDGKSFAFVEVGGQSHDKAEFNDQDFQGSVLKRIRLTPTGQGVEDETQRHVSSHTIKLLSFWTHDRILFLEGSLKSQRIQNPLWDFRKTFTARLTPSPGIGERKISQIGPVDLFMTYCYGFKNLDSKFRNVYNVGMGGRNQAFVDILQTVWCVGLPLPEGFAKGNETYCMRPSPYPFPERNKVVFTSCPQTRMRNILNTLNSFFLRYFQFSSDQETVFFLSNSSGILNVWAGRFEQFDKEYKAPDSSEEEEEPGDVVETDPLASLAAYQSKSGEGKTGESASGTNVLDGLPFDSLPAVPGSQDGSGNVPSTQPSGKKGKGGAQPLESLPFDSIPSGAPAEEGKPAKKPTKGAGKKSGDSSKPLDSLPFDTLPTPP